MRGEGGEWGLRIEDSEVGSGPTTGGTVKLSGLSVGRQTMAVIIHGAKSL